MRLLDWAVRHPQGSGESCYGGGNGRGDGLLLAWHDQTGETSLTEFEGREIGCGSGEGGFIGVADGFGSVRAVPMESILCLL